MLLKTLSVSQAAVSNDVMISINPELYAMWRDAGFVKFEVFFRQFLGGTRERSWFNKPE
jgi:hypothetical protein